MRRDEMKKQRKCAACKKEIPENRKSFFMGIKDRPGAKLRETSEWCLHCANGFFTNLDRMGMAIMDIEKENERIKQAKQDGRPWHKRRIEIED